MESPAVSGGYSSAQLTCVNQCKYLDDEKLNWVEMKQNEFYFCNALGLHYMGSEFTEYCASGFLMGIVMTIDVCSNLDSGRVENVENTSSKSVSVLRERAGGHEANILLCAQPACTFAFSMQSISFEKTEYFRLEHGHNSRLCGLEKLSGVF